MNYRSAFAWVKHLEVRRLPGPRRLAAPDHAELRTPQPHDLPADGRKPCGTIRLQLRRRRAGVRSSTPTWASVHRAPPSRPAQHGRPVQELPAVPLLVRTPGARGWAWHFLVRQWLQGREYRLQLPVRAAHAPGNISGTHRHRKWVGGHPGGQTVYDPLTGVTWLAHARPGSEQHLRPQPCTSPTSPGYASTWTAP